MEGSRKTRIVAVGNQKGGVGKTTNTVHIAAALGERGWKCLIWDLDMNHGATQHFGVPADSFLGTFEVLTGDENRRRHENWFTANGLRACGGRTPAGRNRGLPLKIAATTVVGLSHQSSAGTQEKNSKAHTNPCRIDSVFSLGRVIAYG